MPDDIFKKLAKYGKINIGIDIESTQVPNALKSQFHVDIKFCRLSNKSHIKIIIVKRDVRQGNIFLTSEFKFLENSWKENEKLFFDEWLTETKAFSDRERKVSDFRGRKMTGLV